MKKGAIFATIATVTLLGLSLNAVPGVSASSSNLQTIPETMPPGSIITYDENNHLTVKKPKIRNSDLNVENSTVPSLSDEEKIKLDAKEKEILKQVEEESKNLPVYHLDEPKLPKPQPGMKVFYDGMGLPTKIVDAEGKPVTGESGDIQPMWDKGPGTYTYGTNNKITITSTYVLGEGTVTWYDGIGQTGSDQTKLTSEDCATKQDIDVPPKGTEISLRNLEKDILGTVYKYDISKAPKLDLSHTPLSC